MPAKMSRSAPRPLFRLREVSIAVAPCVCLAGRPERHQYSRRFGSHLGNPGLMTALLSWSLFGTRNDFG
jgi:hypothetical protein